MIVRSTEDRLQLITQPAHARLARRIMEHCVPLAGRDRRDMILLAIREHDNGWEEEDAAPTVNSVTGEVVDFVSAPLSVRYAVWQRGIARLADTPVVAALIAQHAISVHERFSNDPGWTAFFAHMEAARTAMLGPSGLSLDDLMADYAFVRLADLISLAFCTGWTHQQRCDGWSVQLSGSQVLVAPDAFAGARVPIEIEANEIRKQPFRSDDELREALREGRTIPLRGEVAGSGAGAL